MISLDYRIGNSSKKQRTDMRSPDGTGGENHFFGRCQVVPFFVGSSRDLHTVQNRYAALDARLQNLDDLGVDEDIEVAAGECRLNVIPSRVGACPVLNLFS